MSETGRDEGVIKFELVHSYKNLAVNSQFVLLNDCRNFLHSQGLIGEYPDGIGFGNVSILADDRKSFLITGTQTGAKPALDQFDYTNVTQVDFTSHSVYSEGPLLPSSEAVTHAMIYRCSRAKSVIHIHSARLWQSFLKLAGREFEIAIVPESVPYGTVQMAENVAILLSDLQVYHGGIIVMAGHEDGILFFGDSIDEARNRLQYWRSVYFRARDR
ncbi:MAG: class II aldolase/adducin family protein [Leptospiraceae bacterium]|nr:class II aldolase/adducin family protein [Leptospiraceae bacterium]